MINLRGNLSLIWREDTCECILDIFVTKSEVKDLQIEEKMLYTYIHSGIGPIHNLKLAKQSHEGAEKMKE